jgi:hypothetical protein
LFILFQSQILSNLFKNQIEVAWVEVLNAHETVFTATRVALAVGMECQAVDGTEVTFESREFLLVDEMEEARIELAGACGGRGDVHGFLSTAQHDVVEDGADGGGVDGTFGLVGLEAVEGVDVEELGGAILGGGDKHRCVAVHLHVLDGAGVDADRVRLLAHLNHKENQSNPPKNHRKFNSLSSQSSQFVRSRVQ